MISKVGWTEEDHIEYADYLRDMQEEERAAKPMDTPGFLKLFMDIYW